MILVGNKKLKKNLLVVNENLMSYIIQHPNCNLYELLHPTRDMLIDITVEDYFQLLEMNLSLFNLTVKDESGLGFDFSALKEEHRLLLNKKMMERSEIEECKSWLLDTTEGLYVKTVKDTLTVICKKPKTKDDISDLKQLNTSDLKEALLEVFYSKLGYYDIHKKDSVEAKPSLCEVSIANVYELVL